MGQERVMEEGEQGEEGENREGQGRAGKRRGKQIRCLQTQFTKASEV